MLEAVADLDRHAPIAERLRLDPDDHRLAALRNPIFDRILDDRLKDQRGQAGLLEIVGNVDLDLQAVGEAGLLDVEIETLELDLLGQGDVGAGVERKAGAEEGRQREQHGLGAVGAPGHD